MVEGNGNICPAWWPKKEELRKPLPATVHPQAHSLGGCLVERTLTLPEGSCLVTLEELGRWGGRGRERTEMIPISQWAGEGGIPHLHTAGKPDFSSASPRNKHSKAPAQHGLTAASDQGQPLQSCRRVPGAQPCRKQCSASQVPSKTRPLSALLRHARQQAQSQNPGGDNTNRACACRPSEIPPHSHCHSVFD